MSDNSVSALWDSHHKVRDRVVEIDKLVAVHEQNFRELNNTVSVQHGETKGELQGIADTLSKISDEQSYKKGAVNMLGWGIGLFCSMATIVIAFWAVTSRLG